MIGIEIPMPQNCGSCPFLYEDADSVPGCDLKEDLKTETCPLIDLSQYEDDLK